LTARRLDGATAHQTRGNGS